MKQIPITKAVFDQQEKEAIIKPLETGWVVQGPYVKEFETLFSSFIGCQYSKAVSNCTAALHLALEALGIGEGDKVIVPSFTYIASANAVEYTGAEVVFCDINLNTFNIDVQHAQSLLEKDPAIKAIMPVNLFGLCADLDAIIQLASQFGIYVIEDSACGFDAWIDNRHSGTIGHVGCFSFHPRKSITTGEGGMVVTNIDAVYNTVSQLCDHGASKSDLQRHQEKGGSLLPDFTMRGYNYRMTDFQGALGVCQMKKSKDIMAGRRNIALQYDEALAPVTALKLPCADEGFIHGYQSYVCLFTGGQAIDALSYDDIHALNIKRNQFMRLLEEKSIATRQGTHAVHTLEYYRKKYGLNDRAYFNAYAADRLSLALPLYAQMSKDEFEYVIEHLHGALQCVA